MTGKDSSQVRILTDANFDEIALKSELPVIVEFWATWCAPCRSIAPVLDDIAAEYKDKLIVGKMNVDENANTPATYGVRSIPYFIMLKKGEVVDTLTGATKPKLISLVEKLTSSV